MTLRLLSNVTMQPIVAYLDFDDVTIGEYNSIIPELLDPKSAAAAENITHILCLFDTDSLLGEAIYDPQADNRADAFIDALGTFLQSTTTQGHGHEHLLRRISAGGRLRRTVTRTLDPNDRANAQRSDRQPRS